MYLPVDLPESAIVYEVAKPANETWQGFDLTYEGLLTILDRLDQPDELAYQFSEDELKTLRKIIVHMAQLGSLHSTPEESDLLTHDIIQLFTDDEDEDPSDFALSLPTYPRVNWMPASMDFYSDVEVLHCKSVWKRVKKIGRKIDKFRRRNKKEIAIGAAALIGVGVAAYFVVGASPDKNENKTKTQKSEEQVKEQAQEHIAPSISPDEIFSVADAKEPSKTQPSTFIEDFKDEVREAGSMVAHQVWDVVVDTGLLAQELQKEIGNVLTYVASEPNLSHIEAQGDMRNLASAGHEKIDEWFSTHQTDQYDEKHKNRMAERFVIGEIPPPSDLLQEAKDVAKIARALKAGEQGALATEELALTNRQAGAFASSILTPSNGILEIEGRNIKRFNNSAIFKDERKLDHLFKDEHNLHRLNCTKDVALQKITNALVEADKAGKIPLNQRFEIRVMVEGHEVEVRGIVIDGELRYGTFFIPKD